MDIDFVILWVDGNDPVWLKEKAEYQGMIVDDSNSANRFRDWNLLPYWFRAVEKYTPWVRKIHFVTWGHLPAFLDINNPKLHIVKHSDFMPEKYLPTFSSHAIEMNIHRIEGLAEHFVYFNDDMFITKPMNPEDFFRDGFPCTYGGEYPIEVTGKQEIWQHAMLNNLGAVNAHFDKRTQVKRFKKKFRNSSYRWQDNIRTWAAETLFPNYFTGFRNIHGPGAYLKRTFEEVWNAEPELLEQTSMHKFRNADSVNQWICLWWQIASGNFYPDVTDNKVIVIRKEAMQEIREDIVHQKHKMLCLNDPDEYDDFEILSNELQEIFNTILPEKSTFE